MYVTSQRFIRLPAAETIYVCPHRWKKKSVLTIKYLFHYLMCGAISGADSGVEYTWVDIKDDLVALADSLGHQRFVLCGFSIGTSWAMHVAAQVPSRVQGIILFGAMCDAQHPQMDKDTRNKVGRPPAILNPADGMLRLHLAKCICKFRQDQRQVRLQGVLQTGGYAAQMQCWLGKVSVRPFLGLHNGRAQQATLLVLAAKASEIVSTGCDVFTLRAPHLWLWLAGGQLPCIQPGGRITG